MNTSGSKSGQYSDSGSQSLIQFLFQFWTLITCLIWVQADQGSSIWNCSMVYKRLHILLPRVGPRLQLMNHLLIGNQFHCLTHPVTNFVIIIHITLCTINYRASICLLLPFSGLGWERLQIPVKSQPIPIKFRFRVPTLPFNSESSK